MFKFKSSQPYWTEFSSYQTFQTVDELNAAVKRFVSLYDLTDAIKAVLNTIKLHAKRYFGVCWLRKEQIAKKAKVSPSTVDRAIKGLKESGFLTVIPFNHTKFGRRTHNVYVLNSIFDDVPQNVCSIVSDDVPQNVANEVAQEDEKDAEKPVVSTVCESQAETHKNPHTSSNNSLKDLSIKLDNNTMPESKVLKHVPNEFIDILEPFYGHSPKVIAKRWKTLCSAAKKSHLKIADLNWDSVGQAWTDVVKNLKRGKIRDASDEGIGGYFYGVLCDYLLNDWLKLQFA